MSNIQPLDLSDIGGLVTSRNEAIETTAKELFESISSEQIYSALYNALKSNEDTFNTALLPLEKLAEIEQTETDLLKKLEESSYYAEFKRYFEGFSTLNVSLLKPSSDKQSSGHGIVVQFSIKDEKLVPSYDVFKEKREARRIEDGVARLERLNAHKKLLEQSSLRQKFLALVDLDDPPPMPALLQGPKKWESVSLIPHPELLIKNSESDFRVFDPNQYSGLPLDQRSLYDFNQLIVEEVFFGLFSYDALKNRILDAVEDADKDKELLEVKVTIAEEAYKKYNPIARLLTEAFSGYSMENSRCPCNPKTIDSFRPDSFAIKMYSALITDPLIQSVSIGNSNMFGKGDFSFIISFSNPKYQPKTGLAAEMDEAVSAISPNQPKTGDLIQDRMTKFDNAVIEFKEIAEKIEDFDPDLDQLGLLKSKYEAKLSGTDVILYSQDMQSAVFLLEEMTRTLGILNGDIEANRIEKFTLKNIQDISENYRQVLALLDNGINKLDAFYSEDRAIRLKAMLAHTSVVANRAQRIAPPKA